jgi:hypothetical protein
LPIPPPNEFNQIKQNLSNLMLKSEKNTLADLQIEQNKSSFKK